MLAAMMYRKEFTVSMEAFTCQLQLCDPAGVFAFSAQESLLFITDDQVWPALTGPGANPAIRAACQAIPTDRLVVLPAGEANKAWPAIETILNRGFALGLARDSRLVGIGGGVVTDLVAFAASLYMRGCRLSLVPTTLLSMVDAAFGGKTGINFGGYKNMVGSFYPAGEVRVCPEFCLTLPEREYRGGLAEVLKSALLDDAALWQFLKDRQAEVLARQPAALERLIWDSLMVKARIVQADLREASIRAHLNLGHTFAHGLESVAGLGVWSHGEAVAWGMVKAAQLAERLGLCPAAWRAELRQVLEAYGFQTRAPGIAGEDLLRAMAMDKKKKDGKVRFVLQRGLGDTLTQPVEDSDVLAVLAQD